MIQEEKAALTIGKRSFTAGQILLGLIVLLIIGFLIYGTLNPPPADAVALSGAPTNQFVALAFLSFAAGVISFASPCTLPILPAYFAFAFQSGRKTIAANTLAFMLGLASMFSLFGAGASVIGRTLYQQQSLILFVGGSTIIILGIMSLLGKGFSGVQATQTERNTTLSGSFIFGLTFAVGWSSCIGPILGFVTTMALTSQATVVQGAMLLFIFAIGLGIPLIIMSTIFGRASRDSLIWRVLRGKGWERVVATRHIAYVWAIGLWLILMPLIRLVAPTFNVDARPLISNTFVFEQYIGFQLGIYELGLLALLLAGAYLIDTTRFGKSGTAVLHMHSTQLISGVLFIMMGLLFLNNKLAVFNGLVSPEIATWFEDIEYSLRSLFER